MGVCLEVGIGYQRVGAVNGLNFSVDTLFDLDKELSPIYDDIFELEGLDMDVVYFPHAEEGITEDPYGSVFKCYTVKQILEVIESNAVKLLEIPDTIYNSKSERVKGTYKDARWFDMRVQGVIAYLKCIDRNQKIVLSWS